jgi:hypothetical protein
MSDYMDSIDPDIMFWMQYAFTRRERSKRGDIVLPTPEEYRAELISHYTNDPNGE